MESNRVVETDPQEFIDGLNNMLYRKLIFKEPITEVKKKASDDEYVKDIDFLIAIYKDRGMEHSKQVIAGDTITILTALSSMFDNVVKYINLPDKTIEEDIKKLLSDIKKED